MKAEILKILRASRGPVSGERLSAELGASRVAVWKHIRKLRELGYRIDARGAGYRLVSSPDALYPWEFEDHQARIVHYPEIGSTMDAAKALARAGCGHFTVVVAERQTGGRGRLQRPWVSAPGGLYFTLVLRPAVPVLESFKIGFLASLTMARLIERRHQVAARVKWPNDILVGGAKLCGMLVEMEAESDRVLYLNIGMGVNVNNDPPPIDPPAVSLKALTGHPVPRAPLLAAFLEDLEHNLQQLPLSEVVDRWKAASATLGRPVRIVTAAAQLSGVAEDVDDSGALLVRLPGGELRRVIYGDCFIDGDNRPLRTTIQEDIP